MNRLVTTYGFGAYRASEAHVLLRDRGYKPDATKRGCLYSHSLGATAKAAFDPTLAQDALGTIALAGMPTLATDLAGTATWGNDAAQSALTDARTYLQGTGGAAAGKVVIYAPSMGALAALNWARANPTLVAGVALVCPVVDLAYEHDQNVNGFAAQIETAYGGAAGYAAAVAAHDPMQNTGVYAGLPIKMWFASNDTVAVTARQQAFASAVGCPTVSLGAVGHTLTQAPWAEVAAFLAAV